MKNINLCEILKGHEGETFYSPIYGENIKLRTVHPHLLVFENTSSFLPNGSCNEGGECLLFPSKDQRDWNKWIEEQKSKVPKTWSELVNSDKVICYLASIERCWGNRLVERTRTDSPIEKSALALLKINQLIEVGYGRNVNDWEWKDRSITTKWRIGFDWDGEIMIDDCISPIAYTPIAFHTKEQAEEFLKYPENIQLLKDYFMI